MLSDLVGKDPEMDEADRDDFRLKMEVRDPDTRERGLSAAPYYPRMRAVLYPRLRTVRFDFHLHRKGMVKDTVHTTVLDTVYMRGLQAIKDRDYRTAVTLLRPYDDYNAAVAFCCMDYNESALAILDRLEKTPAVKPAFPAARSPLGSYTARPKAPDGSDLLHVRDVAETPDKPFTATIRKDGRDVTYHITPPTAPAEPEPVQQTLEPVREAPWCIVGEVLKTYIICESDSGDVWLIDKHAAHERIRFDALKADPQPLMAQTLLSPMAVTLEGDAYGAVLDNLELLRQFGFGCEDFGGGTVLVREVPADIRAEDAPATLEELGRKLTLGRADPAGARDELLHTMACKSAIKAGMDTSPAEMRSLVEKVQSGQIQYCPHGRPVKYKLTRYEIEKMFKRA